MMKHLQKLLLMLALLAVPWVTQAQSLSDYTLTTDTTTFMSIASTGTAITLSSTDDGQGSCTLPFAFNFGESSINSGTSLSCSANGFINLGGTASGTYGSYTNTSYRIINPLLNQDAHMGRNTGAGVYYQLDTVDGVQCFTIEYHLLGTYTSPYGMYSFQVKLFANGNIQFIYDTMSTGTTSTRTLRTFLWDGPEGDLAVVTGDWASPSFGTTINTRPNTPEPAHGLRYTFTRPVVSCPKVNNLTASSLTATSATITWQDTNASSWMFYYYPTELITLMDSALVYDTTYTLSSLSANNNYTVQVVALCSDTESSLPRTLSFYTPCVAVEHDSLPYFEGFEDWATGSSGGVGTWRPDNNCWDYATNYTSSTAHYPYVSSSYANNGTKSLYMYKPGSSYWADFSLPLFEDSVTDLMLSFYMRNAYGPQANYHIVVGVKTDLSNPLSFTPTDTLWTDETNTWERKELMFLNYTGLNGYITLRCPMSSPYCYTYVDDITVEELPSCLTVTDLTADSVTTDEITLSWHDNSNATEWLVSYSYSDTTVEMNVYDTTVTLTGLSANTPYTIQVMALCGSDDSSHAAQLVVRTSCGVMTVLPYTEDFETATTGGNTNANFVPCWNRLNDGTTYFGYPYVSSSSTYNHTLGGTKGLYWYCSTTTGTYGSYQCLVMPAVDTVTYPINSLQVKLWAKASSTSYAPIFQIGVMTNPDSIESFTQVSTINVSGTNFTEYLADLSSYTGYGQYVAIRANRSTSSWYAYVDDITLEVIPSCPTTVNLMTNNVSTTSAQLTWEDQGGLTTPTEYEITVSSDTAGTTNTYSSTTTSFFLTGLSTGTPYHVVVRANCDSEGYGLADSVDLTTAGLPCVAMDTTSLDTVVFSTGTGTSSGVLVYSDWGNTMYQTIYTAAELTAAGLSSGAITGVDFGFSAHTGYAKEFTIMMGNTSRSTFSSSTDYENPNDLQQVYGPEPFPTGSAGFQHFDFDEPFFWDGASNIIVITFMNQPTGTSQSISSFMGYYTSAGTTRSLYRYKDGTQFTLDNYTTSSGGSTSSNRATVTFYTGECEQYATCVAPNVVAENITATSVDLSWAAGYDETSWDVDYRVAGTSTWTNELSGTASTSTTITGLTPATDYEFRVSSVCSDTTMGTVVSVTTPCMPMELPFTESFEGWATGTPMTPANCWHKISQYSTSYPYVNTSYAYEGTKAVYMYAYSANRTGLVLPLMNAQVDSLQVSFMLLRSNTSYLHGVQVGVMSDPEDFNTFTPVANCQVNEPAGTWVPFEVSLSSYTGNGQYIAFMNQPSALGLTYSYPYLDMIEVDYIPPCPRPSNVTVTCSGDTAYVSWHGSSSSSYEIEYGPAGFAHGGGIVATVSNDTNAVLTGLRYSTGYQIYVRNICNDGADTGAWSFAKSFVSTCGPITAIPFTDNFSVWGTGTSAFPTCWTRINEWSSSYPYIYASQSYDNYGGALYMYHGAGSSNNTGFSLPAIDTDSLTINNLQIEFQLKASSPNGNGVIVGLSETGYIDSTFYPLDTIISTGAWQLAEVPLNSDSCNGTHVTIMAYTLSGNNSTYIDNIYLGAVPTCVSPTNLHANAVMAADSVVIAWNARGTATSWDIAYDSVDFDPDNTEGTGTFIYSVTDNPYTMPTLTLGTSYYIYVRSDCGGDYSRWIGPLNIIPGSYNMPASGSDTLYACGGIIYDDGGPNGNYGISCNGTLVLRPSSPDSLVTLYGTYSGESCCDYLSIFDGEGVLGTRLFYQYGSNITIGPLTSTQGALTIMFTSDGSVTGTGMELHVGCEARPECAEVTDVAANSVAGASALMTWDYISGLGGAPSYYEVEYQTDTIIVTDTTSNNWYLLSGLTQGTPYVFRVRSYCDSNSVYGAWDSVSFVTGCLAGGDVAVGTGTSEMEYGPTYSCYEYSYSQSIYPSIAVGGSNTFTGISWYVSSTMSTTRNLTVYMGTTSQSSFSSETNIIPLSSLTQVATGTVNCSTTGWKHISFTTPFVYNGTDNLVVAVDDNTGSYECTVGWRGTPATSATLDWYQDGTDINPASPTNADSYEMENYYPNIILTGTCDTTIGCVAPNLFVTNIGTTTAELTWAPGLDDTVWSVEYKTIEDTAWTLATASTTATSYTVTGLLDGTTYLFRVGSLCSDTTVYGQASGLTECLPKTVPFFEDFEDWATGTNGADAPCWSRMNSYNISYNYPYVSASYAFSGTKSMYMYSTSASYSILILPEMAPAVDSLQISFMLRRTNTSYQHSINVGVMTDPTDVSTFTQIETVMASAINTWEPFEIPLSDYEGTGRFIALMSPNGVYSYPYLDDIEVTYIPTCRRPIEVSATSITQTSATVHWVDSNDAGDYEIEYGLHGFDRGTGTMVTATDDSVALTGLTPTSRYDVYVRAICMPGDTSNWSFLYTFATACGDLPIPYSQDFDSYASGTTGGFPECWTKGSSYNSNYPYVSPSYHSSGSNSLYLYSSGTTYTYAATPRTSVPADSLEVSFKLYRTSTTATYGEVILGVMTDPTDFTTFTPMDTLQPSTTSIWTSFVSYLDSYSDTGRYIAVATQNSGYDAVYLDDFEVDYIPSCLPPSHFNSLVTDHTATVHWHGNAGSYAVKYGPAGFDPDTATAIIVTADSIALTGLDSATTYDIYVTGLCDTNDLSETVLNTFSTLRAAPVSTYPFICTFADSTIANGWDLVNGTQSNQWWIGSATASGTADNMSMYISNDNGLSNGYNTSATTNVFAYRTFSMPVGQYSISYDWKAYGESCCDYMRVALVPTDVDLVAGNTCGFSKTTQPAGAISLDIASNLVSNWTHREAEINITSAGSYNLVIFWHNDGSVGTTPPGAIDNIEVWRNTCPAPYDVAVTMASTSSMEVDWTDLGSPVSYQLEYGLQGFTRGTGTLINTTSHPVTLTGLDTLTAYDVYIRPICTGADTGRWTMATLSTAFCDNALVTAIGSESSTTTSYNAPVNNFFRYTLSETIIDSAELGGAQDISAISYYYSYASPMTDKTNCTIYLQPTTKTTFSGTSDIEVLDTVNAVMVYSGSLNCTQGWNLFVFDTTYSYDGNGNLMVIVDDNSYDYNGSSYVFKTASCTGYKTITYYSDSYNPSPTSPSSFSGSKTYYQWRPVMQLTSCNAAACPQPVITSETHDYQSATITWTGSGSTYQVNIKEAAAIDWPATDITVTGNTYTFTGLTSATNYTYRVRQDCSADSLGFGEWTVSGLLTDSLPCLAPDSLVVSGLTNAQGTFTWVVNGFETQWDLHVWNTGVLDTVYRLTTNPATVGGFTAGVTYNAAVRPICGSEELEGDYGDTITFTTLTCPDVTGLTSSNVTESSVTLNWTADPMAESWLIEYGYTGFAQGTGTSVTTDVNTYVVNDLEDETSYDFYVKAVCGTDWNSEEWTHVSATTLTAEDPTYTVTVNVNDASMGTATGGGTYHAGESCTVTATANDGYHFVNWSNGETENPYTFTVVANITLTANFAADSPEGIDDVIGDAVCTIYPNPTSDVTTISVSGVNGKVSITVVDMNGRTVASETLECSSDCQKTMDVDNLAQGAYFVKITGENLNLVKKLIVR